MWEGESPGPGIRPTRLLAQLRRLQPGHLTPLPSSPWAILLFLVQVQGQRCSSSQPWTLNLKYSNQRGRGTPLASCARRSVQLGPVAHSLVKGHAGHWSEHWRPAGACPRGRHRDGGRPLLPTALPPRPPNDRPLKVGMETSCQKCTLTWRCGRKLRALGFAGADTWSPALSAACTHGPWTRTGLPAF